MNPHHVVGGASPLLLTHDEGDDVPTLGGGGLGSRATPGMMDLDIDQSPLERLIAQSTSEQRGDMFFLPREDDDGDDHDDTNSPFRHPNDGRQGRGAISIRPRENGDSDDDDDAPAAKPSLVTLIAGTLCVVHAGLVWASFISSSWFDTHLKVSLALPLIKRETDQILHSTTLASLVSDLLTAQEHWAAIFLIVTSLVLPCLCSVCAPAWTMVDHETGKEQRRPRTGRRGGHSPNHRHTHDATWMSPRLFLEYTMRACFTVFFLLCVLDVGTSSIEIDSNNTRFVVNNRTQGGLVCFSIGITCSMVVILLLRMATTSLPTSNGRIEDHAFRSQRQQDGRPRTESTTNATAPPDGAFQLPWNILAANLVASNLFSEQQGDQELQTPLLFSPVRPSEGLWNDADTPPITNTTHVASSSTQRLPNHLAIETVDYEDTTTGDVGGSVTIMPFWKRAVIYELAAMSTLLWLPALFLPLFELTYTGVVSDFMPEVSFSVLFWEFPAVLWQRGIAAGTAQWVLLVVGGILVFFVYVCPLLATLLAIATWRMDPLASAYCRNVLWTIQPCICGIVFALSLQLAIPAFEAVGEYAIDTGSSGLCKKFEIITSDTCMTIVGEPRVGLWFLLAQTLSLEAFVALTLVWNQR